MNQDKKHFLKFDQLQKWVSKIKNAMMGFTHSFIAFSDV